MKTLNPKQEAFCREYVLDFNGAQSAIRAGYSKKTSRTIASEHLTKPHIQAFIKQLLTETAEEYKVDRDRVLRLVVDMAENGEKEQNRRGALDMLMRHTGGYEQDNTHTIHSEIKYISVLPEDDDPKEIEFKEITKHD